MLSHQARHRFLSSLAARQLQAVQPGHLPAPWQTTMLVSSAVTNPQPLYPQGPHLNELLGLSGTCQLLAPHLHPLSISCMNLDLRMLIWTALMQAAASRLDLTTLSQQIEATSRQFHSCSSILPTAMRHPACRNQMALT